MQKIQISHKHQGAVNHAAGLAAEDQVEALYHRQDMELVARRWKNPNGELDLVHLKGHQLIFTEVKRSKTHARAVQSLSARQQQRLLNAACAFLAATDRSMDTDMQFNVATCDGHGQIHILENAIAA